MVSIPVSFRVGNTNTSALPCQSDGQTYTVRGHLTAPRAALTDPRAVTLYLFGYDAGEWNWRLTAVPGYNFAAGMARAGAVSVTIDELGYGASDLPDGMATCVGAQADMAHQVVDDLRAGTYRLDAGRGLAFDSVVLAGHDVGGLVAEVEAYSYKDIDGLIQVTWADQGQTPYIVQRASEAGIDWCTTEPQSQSDAPGSPPNYHYFTSSPDEFRQKLFFDPDPAVLEAATRLRSRDPCGIIRSTPNGVPIDKARAGEIAVPVLVVFGDKDTLVWSHDGEEQQQDNFTASPDKTTAFIPNSGHYPMLERTAPQFRAVLAAWLDRHGFGYPGEGSPAARLRVRSSSVRVGRDRLARVRLNCAAATTGRCDGTLRLLPAAAGRTRPARGTVGSAHFHLTGGKSASERVRLSRRGYRHLVSRGELHVLAVATGSGLRTTRTRLRLTH